MQALLEILTREENVRMQYEILLMLCVFSIPALKLKNKRHLAAAWGTAATVFLYLHRILLPVLVSGVYLYCLLGICAIITTGKPSAFLLPLKALSRKAAVFLQQPMVLYTLPAVLILLIQACRINIAVDYDSLRYGLRSDVLLTGGHGLSGFFENTGLVNLVYTYPKGFEVLTRPLYFGHTWGYILCTNFWILAVVLLLAGAIAGTVTGSSRCEVFTVCLLSLVPGVTNMAVTAKSDLITLLCQLIFLYCAVCFLKNGENEGGSPPGRLVGIGTAALIASYGLKPTALVFSSLLGLTVLVFLLLNRKNGPGICLDAGGIRILLLSLLFTGVMTARTFLITGMPFTSVFTGLFEALGMRLHYPFRIQSLTGAGSLGLSALLRTLFTRLFAVLFCPAGEDMAHVRMAWGGLGFTLMLLLVLFFGRGTTGCLTELEDLRRIRQSEHIEALPEEDSAAVPAALQLLFAVCAVTGAMSLLSLLLLYQIDGNYFMLLYAAVVITGSSILYIRASFESSPLGKNLPVLFSGASSRAMILLAAVMIYFTAFSGWAGPVGFTPVDPVNRGYYNHEAEFGVSDPLHWDKHTRVLAFAEEPDCYLLKGRVESWVDLDGSGGNVYLTDTKLNIFKEYCHFADIDYIYADLRFLHDKEDERHIRANTLFIYMLEDGDFEETVLAENSSCQVFAKVDKERMSENWEVPLSAEKLQRTNEQCSWFESIGGYE